MALKAERAHVAACQKPRVRRSHRSMAGSAAADPHGNVLEDERSALIAVTARATLVELSGAPSAGEEPVMLPVTIHAGQESLIDAVMKGH